MGGVNSLFGRFEPTEDALTEYLQRLRKIEKRGGERFLLGGVCYRFGDGVVFTPSVKLGRFW